MKTIIYLLGVVASIWCVVDIWKKNLDVVKKILLTLLVLLTSWVGLAIYYFIIKDRI